MIPGFRREVDEKFVLLGYYAASSGNLLPTFQDNLSGPSSRVKKMGLIGFTKRRKGITSTRCVIAQKLTFCLLHIISCEYNTRVGTLIVATIYLQLIQNRYMFRSFTVLQCSHQQSKSQGLKPL